jgi:hypothetical protein
LVVTPEALLDIGAEDGIDIDEADELVPLPELLSVPLPQAARPRAVTAATPMPAMRRDFTVISVHSGWFERDSARSRQRIGARPGFSQDATKVMECQPVAPSGTVPARASVWV